MCIVIFPFQSYLVARSVFAIVEDLEMRREVRNIFQIIDDLLRSHNSERGNQIRGKERVPSAKLV